MFLALNQISAMLILFPSAACQRKNTPRGQDITTSYGHQGGPRARHIPKKTAQHICLTTLIDTPSHSGRRQSALGPGFRAFHGRGIL
ncbi:hypothetical protein BC834DRAFT_904460 [Gloeopeniophorella convolvens]|nr:hypothetical protein BC834DRAFT_904460 [Gloeopeniophorella convolvens]